MPKYKICIGSINQTLDPADNNIVQGDRDGQTMEVDLYKAHPLEIRLTAFYSKVAKVHKSQGNSKVLSSVIKAGESTKTANSMQSPGLAVVH